MSEVTVTPATASIEEHAADLALSNWRSMTTDLRAAALAAIEPLNEWEESQPADSRFHVNACRCERGEKWHVETNVPDVLAVKDAEALAVAIRSAAATATSLNATDRFSIATYGRTSLGRDEATDIGKKVPLVATYFEGMADLTINIAKAWADKLTTPGTRWTSDRDEAEETDAPRMHFLFVGWFLLDGIVHEDGNPRLALQSIDEGARA